MTTPEMDAWMTMVEENIERQDDVNKKTLLSLEAIDQALRHNHRSFMNHVSDPDAHRPVPDPEPEPEPPVEPPTPPDGYWYPKQPNMSWPDPSVEGRILVKPGTHQPIDWENVDEVVVKFEEGAVIKSSGYHGNAGIGLRDCNDIYFIDAEITNCLWGVYAHFCTDIRFSHPYVHHVGQEGMQFSNNCKVIRLISPHIAHTGLRPGNHPRFGVPYSAFGEGIYLGNGHVAKPDRTQDIRIFDPKIHHTTGEAIDIKPGVIWVLVKDGHVNDCQVSASGAIVAGIGPGSTMDPNHVIIDGVTVARITDSTPYADGNGIKVSTAATIINCDVEHCSNRGIFVEGEENDMAENTPVIVRNNTAENSPLNFQSWGAAVKLIEEGNSWQ